MLSLASMSMHASPLDDAAFPAFHDRISDLWFKKQDYAGIASLGKPLIGTLTPAQIQPKHQEIIYRVCVALFEIRDYASTFKCLDHLKAAVLRNGDRVKLDGFYFLQSQKDFIQGWPILPKVDLFLADLWLELGQPGKARQLVEPAYLAYEQAMAGSLAADTDKYFQFGEARHHFLSTLAIAYQQTGKPADAAGTLERLTKLGMPFTKEAKTYAESKLIRTLVALGRFDQALALIEVKSEASDRAREAAGALIFSALTLALSPVDSIVGGSQALGRALYADMHTPLTRFVFAHARLETGDYETSRQELDRVLAAPEIKGMGGIYWSALYDRGRIHEKEQQFDQAIRLYRQAIEVIEQQRSTINTEGARIGFFGDKQGVYQALVRLLFQAGRYEDAFLIGERSKSRALVDMLASKQDFHLGSADNRRIEELLASTQIGEISLNRNTAADGILVQRLSQRGVKNAEGKIDANAFLEDLRNLKIEARSTLAVQHPELAALVSVPNVSLAEIRHGLPTKETLVSYYHDSKNLYAFIITHSTLHAVQLRREGLEGDVQALRQAIESQVDVRSKAQALHARLIAPLVEHLKTEKLLVASHGALHYLPFAALHDGQQFMLDRYQMTFLPSASTLNYVGRNDTRNKAGMLLAFGNPDLGEPQYDLIHAEREAREIGSLFPNSKVLLRQAASKRNLHEHGSGFRYLHFATHGKFNASDPLNSALMLASPSVQNVGDRLTIGELYSMRMNADLVTLSACETGLGEVANGDDVVGLVRGFLYAGANQVISTLWEIDDTATANLMTDFYRRIKSGKSHPDALRQSQQAIRQSHPHPFFWAAFQITGGAGKKM